MNWIIKNISHIALALTFMISVFAIMVGHRKKRRRGEPLNTTDRVMQIALILLILVSCIAFGILISR